MTPYEDELMFTLQRLFTLVGMEREKSGPFVKKLIELCRKPAQEEPAQKKSSFWSRNKESKI